MPTVDLITEYVIRYGFQVLGAILVFAVGALVARWAGKLTQQWLERHDMEPPIRMLLAKTIQVLILVFTTMAALGQLGVQIAPLLAGIGVAGLGVGLALQGVLSNVFAGLSIIFTKPYRVGEHISLLGVEGDVLTIDGGSLQEGGVARRRVRTCSFGSLTTDCAVRHQAANCNTRLIGARKSSTTVVARTDWGNRLVAVRTLLRRRART